MNLNCEPGDLAVVFGLTKHFAQMSQARESVWSSDRVGMDGLTYSVSYFGTEEHIRQLQRVGLAPKNLDQVVGLERVADETVAILEAGMHAGVMQ